MCTILVLMTHTSKIAVHFRACRTQTWLFCVPLTEFHEVICLVSVLKTLHTTLDMIGQSLCKHFALPANRQMSPQPLFGKETLEHMVLHQALQQYQQLYALGA